MAKDKLLLEHTFSPGDQVVSLVPLIHSPFQARFCGRFTVLRGVTDQKLYSVNPKPQDSENHIIVVSLCPCQL